MRKKLAAAGAFVLAAVGVVAVSEPVSAATLPFATPATCTIQAFDTGRFLTAVGGGGQTTDAIHTDATLNEGWEMFAIVDAGGGHVGIKTASRNYVTAVGGGGRTTDVIHTDATQLLGWEQFTLVPAPTRPADVFAIQTFDGHYLTAVGGGGRTTDAIHSDATQIGGWEEFRVTCVGPNFDPRSCTNLASCWTEDLNEDGVMDSVGIVPPDSPFAGMANLLIADLSSNGGSVVWGSGALAVADPEATDIRITCVISADNPHRSFSQRGYVKVGGRIVCTAPVASLSMNITLFHDAVPANQGSGATLGKEFVFADTSTPCFDGIYDAFAKGTVLFPPGFFPVGGNIEKFSNRVFIKCVQVANTLGLPESSAKAALTQQGLAVGTVTRQISNAPVGTVISQSPPPGFMAVGGEDPDVVDLVLSRGNAVVPNLLGFSERDARASIEGAGLVVGSVTHPDDCVDPGNVEWQHPTGGANVLQGSTVDIRVSACSGGIIK